VAEFSIEQGGAGLVARGELTFATARAARAAGQRALLAVSSASVPIDCSGVTKADSAGLAVLLDWLGAAKSSGKTLRFDQLPNAIVAIAQISELDELLVPAG
jgi:phospholipid transport system transporter-binding protein